MRYHRTASVCAQRTVDPITAEDVVSDAFLKLYTATSAGGGPTESLRSYLMSIVRNAAIDTLRRRREILVDTRDPAIMEIVDEPAYDEIAARGELTAKAALATLPERWKVVLWAMEVEGRSRHQVAQLLGINAGAVSALALRARGGLRRSYLTLHRRSCRPGPCDCSRDPRSLSRDTTDPDDPADQTVDP